MAKVTFITKDKETIVAQGTQGSLMELAVDHHVTGIDGDCGGVCSCTTCHVHLDPTDFEKLGGIDDVEKYLLELDEHVTPYSRLACQIEIDERLDGMIISVAN